MTSLRRAFDASRDVADEAYRSALVLEKQTMTSVLTTPDVTGGIGRQVESAKERQLHGYFKGWLYSAIHAVSCTVAGQPTCVARMEGAGEVEGEPWLLASAYEALARAYAVAGDRAAAEE